MSDVAVITTGGTIGSALQGKSISVEQGAGRLGTLLQQLAAAGGNSVRIVSALNKLSENMEPKDWATLLDATAALVREGYKSIVVTHGTDTLHYTAAYLSQFVRASDVRICFTGAFYAPDRPDSDAGRNVKCAFDVATSTAVPGGVYAGFGESDEAPGGMVARAGEVVVMEYDERRFRRLFATGAPNFDGARLDLPPEVAPYVVEVEAPGGEDLQKAQASVAFGFCYPGDMARCWTHLPENAVLVVKSYHGGTAANEGAAFGLRQLARERPDLAICLASVPSQLIPAPYETSRGLADAGIWVLKNVPPHVVYVAALTRAACGKTGAAALEPFRSYRI